MFLPDDLNQIYKFIIVESKQNMWVFFSFLYALHIDQINSIKSFKMSYVKQLTVKQSFLNVMQYL